MLSRAERARAEARGVCVHTGVVLSHCNVHNRIESCPLFCLSPAMALSNSPRSSILAFGDFLSPLSPSLAHTGAMPGHWVGVEGRAKGCGPDVECRLQIPRHGQGTATRRGCEKKEVRPEGAGRGALRSQRGPRGPHCDPKSTSQCFAGSPCRARSGQCCRQLPSAAVVPAPCQGRQGPWPPSSRPPTPRHSALCMAVHGCALRPANLGARNPSREPFNHWRPPVAGDPEASGPAFRDASIIQLSARAPPGGRGSTLQMTLSILPL